MLRLEHVDRFVADQRHRELDPLAELVDDLAHARDPEEFDIGTDQPYDEADADRVWIRTL